MFWCDTASCLIVGKAPTPSGGITALRKGSISISWLDYIFYKWGYPHSWMVDFMENTIYRWMTGGTPMTKETSISFLSKKYHELWVSATFRDT